MSGYRRIYWLFFLLVMINGIFFACLIFYAEKSAYQMPFNVIVINSFLLCSLIFVATYIYNKVRNLFKISEFYRRAVDSVAKVSITDSKGQVSYINRAFETISGYGRHEVLGKDIRFFNIDPYVGDFFKNLQSAEGVWKAWQGVLVHKRKDGEPYWIDLTIVPLVEKNNQVKKFLNIGFDITKQKKLEEKLLKEQEELRQFFDTSLDFLCIAGIDGHFKKVNQTFIVQLGYSEEELLTKPFFDFIHPDDLEPAQNELKKLAEGSPLISFKCRFLNKFGNCFTISWSATPNSSGILYVVGRDISEKERVDQEMKIMIEKAHEASRAKTMFLANMGHEIRTPLNGMLGMTELLNDENISDVGRRHLQIIKNCGRTLLDLINDILDFSKIEAGKLTLEKIPFSLSDTIHEIVSLLYLKANEKGLKVTMGFDASLPQYISADVTKIRQVIMNLLSNAIKFTSKGYIKIKAKLIEQNEEVLLIQVDVVDSGLGIDEKVKHNLFQSFSQLDASTTRKYGGTGLGLAICKGICEAMEGNIWVESSIGKGSTFSFTFKADLADEIHTKLQTGKDFFDPHMGTKYPLNILVVDDNEVNRLVAVKFLEKIGYAADSLDSGIKALKRMETKNYDIIFLDSHMPEMDGFETTRKIQEMYSSDPKSIPWIVSFTANVNPEDQEKIKSFGMDDFLGKPFTMYTLSAVLYRLLGIEQKNNNEENIRPPQQIDLESMQKHFLGDEDILQEVILRFLETLPGFLQELRTAIEEKNAEKLRMVAHTLKGSVSNFFAEDLRSCLFEMEQMGQNNKMELSADLYKIIKNKCEALSQELLKIYQQKK